MVEGAILLRQDHDVLDVLDRAGASVRGKRQRAIDALRKRSRNRGGAEKAEKVAATSICHCSQSLIQEAAAAVAHDRLLSSLRFEMASRSNGSCLHVAQHQS